MLVPGLDFSSLPVAVLSKLSPVVGVARSKLLLALGANGFGGCVVVLEGNEGS